MPGLLGQFEACSELGARKSSAKRIPKVSDKKQKLRPRA